MGDLGGNDFAIKHYDSHSPSYANSLHYIWDHLFDQFPEVKVKNPMTKIQWNILSSFATERMMLHPYESLKDQMTTNSTVASWAEESHVLSRDFAYKNVVEGEDVTPEYMLGARQIVNKRLAIAGYRLADLMRKIYWRSQQPSETPAE